MAHSDLKAAADAIEQIRNHEKLIGLRMLCGDARPCRFCYGQRVLASGPIQGELERLGAEPQFAKTVRGRFGRRLRVNMMRVQIRHDKACPAAGAPMGTRWDNAPQED